MGDSPISMKKPFKVRLEVTWKDYNYLYQSLWNSILQDRETIEKYGRNHGNIADLHDYSVRVLKKLERQFESSRREYLGPKQYLANKRAIAKFIKNAFKSK
jgi:hypothetical protein